jgi:hypothetical protein
MDKDFFGMSEADVVKTAALLADRTDKNSPAMADSPQALFKMVEDGFSLLEEEVDFMSYMDVNRGERNERNRGTL